MRTLRRIAVLAALACSIACGPAGDTAPSAPVPSPSSPPACPSFVSASAGLPETGEWRSHPAIGDVNGDGLGDLAALARKGDGPSVFLGDGLGSWTEASAGLKYARSFSCGIGTRLVDIDGDGWTDLVAADHCRGVKVYRGDGGTSWTDASAGIPENVEGFNDADVADLDGDGRLDIVAISAFSRGFLVLKGRARGGWEVAGDTGLPEIGSGFEVEVIDADGDGRLDIVASFNPASVERRSEPPPPAKVWLGQPDGRFLPGRSFPAEGRYFGLATLERGDLPGVDLVFGLTGVRAGVWVYDLGESGEWIERGPLDAEWIEGPRPGFIGVHAADVDADGCSDLLLGGGRPMRVWLALGDCGGGFRICPETTFPTAPPVTTIWGVTAGDLNGDGRLDVAAASGSDGGGGLRAWFQTTN